MSGNSSTRKGGIDIDLESFFRSRLDNMLVTASWVDEVKRLLGIAGVSQIWSAHPAWYVWLEKAEGAYGLELDETLVESPGSGEYLSSLFSVRCYPFPGADVFPGFSFEEQGLVLSPLFDRTNTPVFDHKDKIDRALFRVASIEYSTDVEDRWSLFTLQSLDTLRLWYASETVEHCELLNSSRAFQKGDVARKVPGWDLGLSLFDRMVSLYAFYAKRHPVRVALTRSPGWSFTADGQGEVNCHAEDDSWFLSLMVLFADGSDEGRSQGDALMRQDLCRHDQVVQYDLTFPCSCADHVLRDERETPFLNKLWWSIPHLDCKSELGSVCGCH